MSVKRDVPHFRIGLLLTEAGIVAPEHLNQAVQEGDERGTPFLRVLVASGKLTQHELQAVIRVQSLIWSGLLDVDRAIQALAIVHAENVSIDEGLSGLGWVRPPGSLADTVSGAITEPIDHFKASANGLPQSAWPDWSTADKSETMQKFQNLLVPSAAGTEQEQPSCQYCGAELLDQTGICQFCTGENRISRTRMVGIEPSWQKQELLSDGTKIVSGNQPRDPLLMAFFSGCIFPGIGQILLGQYIKGASLLLLSVLLCFVSGGISALVISPIAALDAYLLADKLKNRKSVGTWEFF